MRTVRKRGLVDWHHAEVLTERYLAVTLSDVGGTAILLGQAPIIAWFIILVWGDVDTATDSLYFVLTLAAVWFGCINSCREIVKEKAILARERAVGLDVGAYVLSKVAVLSVLGFVQCLCLVVLVDRWVPIKGNAFYHLLFLFGASLAGTALGLALSAVSGTPERAVAGVPILLLPQILFSDVVMTDEFASRTTQVFQKLTITEWSYGASLELTRIEPSWQVLAGDALCLAVMSAVLGWLAVLALRVKG